MSTGDVTTPAAVELAVDGMHCESCVALIEETLGEDPGVRRVTVDLESGRASVVFDPAAVSPEQLCATVVELGYQASPLGPVESGP